MKNILAIKKLVILMLIVATVVSLVSCKSNNDIYEEAVFVLENLIIPDGVDPAAVESKIQGMIHSTNRDLRTKEDRCNLVKSCADKYGLDYSKGIKVVGIAKKINVWNFMYNGNFGSLALSMTLIVEIDGKELYARVSVIRDLSECGIYTISFEEP